jgi:hypothetical protein
MAGEFGRKVLKQKSHQKMAFLDGNEGNVEQIK